MTLQHQEIHTKENFIEGSPGRKKMIPNGMWMMQEGKKNKVIINI